MGEHAANKGTSSGALRHLLHEGVEKGIHLKTPNLVEARIQVATKVPSPRLRGEGGAKRRMRSLWVVLLFLIFTPAHAVQPDEILKDQALEARARNISTVLRCLVCQNQSIDESDAPVARDLRILIREQLTAKKTDGEVMDFVVARYGDYVLLKPRFGVKTLALWLSPFMLLLAGFAFFFRSGKSVGKPQALSDTEKAELAALLRK